MKECCEKWLMGLSPRRSQKGKFREKHKCPTCGKEYNVLFEGISLLGGEIICSVIGVE